MRRLPTKGWICWFYMTIKSPAHPPEVTSMAFDIWLAILCEDAILNASRDAL